MNINFYPFEKGFLLPAFFSSSPLTMSVFLSKAQGSSIWGQLPFLQSLISVLKALFSVRHTFMPFLITSPSSASVRVTLAPHPCNFHARARTVFLEEKARLANLCPSPTPPLSRGVSHHCKSWALEVIGSVSSESSSPQLSFSCSSGRENGTSSSTSKRRRL